MTIPHLSSSAINNDGHGRPLAERVAIVTGAGTGIGRSAAMTFARQGASVVLAARRLAELEQVADAITEMGGTAMVMQADIGDEAAVAHLVDATVARFGRLDIAFNNAGAPAFAPIEQMEVAQFDQVLAINTRGTWLMLKHEIAAMRAAGNGGAIVNTSSIAATGGTAGLSAYAASKAAVDAMTRVLALETGADGIRINNVSPGMTLTAMSDGMPEPMLAAIAAHTGLKRLALPDDVGDVAVWLCTDAARYITGQSILVDGGFNIAGAR